MKFLNGCIFLVCFLLLSVSVYANPTVYPLGTTIYKPEKCWNGFTILSVDKGVLIDMNGNLAHLWKGKLHHPNKVYPGGYLLSATTPWRQGRRQDDLDVARVSRGRADHERSRRRHPRDGGRVGRAGRVGVGTVLDTGADRSQGPRVLRVLTPPYRAGHRCKECCVAEHLALPPPQLRNGVELLRVDGLGASNGL